MLKGDNKVGSAIDFFLIFDIIRRRVCKHQPIKEQRMWIPLGMLVALSAIGAYTYDRTESVVSVLNVTAWSFTFYMLGKLVFVCVRVPRHRVYVPPRVSIPATIDRAQRPVLTDQAVTEEERAVKDLVHAIIRKIEHAADEGAIHTFVQAKLTLMRRRTQERFSGITSQIYVIGFEGIIGTLIGLITFMAQATVLFQIPDIVSKDTAAFVSTMIKNLNQIDLITVATAFITSIIGWGAKAWIGQWIEARKGVEYGSITHVEGWVQDEILARLSLPTQMKTLLELVNLPELHRPIVEAVQLLRGTSDEMHTGIATSGRTLADLEQLARGITQRLGPELERVVHHLGVIGDLEFDVRHVDGGIRLIPMQNPKLRGNGDGRRKEGFHGTAADR